MKRSPLATLLSVYVCPHRGLGRALVLSVNEGMSQFQHDGFVSADCLTAIVGWLNPGQWINSGRCRAT